MSDIFISYSSENREVADRIGRRIVFLHQFVKKTDKTPPKELKIARQRMKELKP